MSKVQSEGSQGSVCLEVVRANSELGPPVKSKFRRSNHYMEDFCKCWRNCGPLSSNVFKHLPGCQGEEEADVFWNPQATSRGSFNKTEFGTA